MDALKDVGLPVLGVGALVAAGGIFRYYGDRYFKRKAEQYIDEASSCYESLASKKDLKKCLRKLERSAYHAGDEKAEKARVTIRNIENLLEGSSDDKPTEAQKVVQIQDFYLKNGTQDE